MRPLLDAHSTSGKVPDLLLRLEREVGPVADSLWTKPNYGRVLLRALRRTAIAAIAMAGIVIAWPYIASDPWHTEPTGVGASETEEVARLRAALAASEALQQTLRAELRSAEKKLYGLEHTHSRVWHEDTNLLLYRSPFAPR